MRGLIDLLAKLTLQLIDGLRVSLTQRPAVSLLVSHDLLMNRTKLRGQLLRLIAGQVPRLRVECDAACFHCLASACQRCGRTRRRRCSAMGLGIDALAQGGLELLDSLGIGRRKRSPVGLLVRHDLAVYGGHLGIQLPCLITAKVAGFLVRGDSPGKG